LAGSLLFIFLCGIPGLSPAAITHYFSDDLRNHLNAISGHIYNDEFDEAEELVNDLQDKTGPCALASLYRAILYQSRMMAAESDFLEDKFLASLDSVRFFADSMLAGDANPVLAYYYLGNQFAFKSLYQGRAGQTWGALKSGLAARKAYSKGYELDPHFHDIALGLGSYRYWKSVKTSFINWTPLFKNEKRGGIELLRLAADSSEISRDAAQTALIWVYINEKRYSEALRIIDNMKRRYPHGLTFLWAEAEVFYKLEDFRTAADIYRSILERLRKSPGNYYNIIESAYYIDDCYRKIDKRGGDESASGVHDSLKSDISSYTIPEETRKRQEKKLKKLSESLN